MAILPTEPLQIVEPMPAHGRNDLRRSLIAGEGDWSFFVTRPISAVCLAAALLLAIGAALPALKRWRKTTLVED